MGDGDGIDMYPRTGVALFGAVCGISDGDKHEGAENARRVGTAQIGSVDGQALCR